MIEEIDIGPQPGKQEQFMFSTADIVLYGGAAGGGKSHGLLLEAARNYDVPEYGAVIFRASLKQVKNQGGLWDSSTGIYPHFGAEPKVSTLSWVWPKYPSKITFAHLDTEDSVLDWQGSQIPLIEFDELTHFSRKQFFYMLSRNRSTCGVVPYVRASTNPDADSWVRDLIDWWIGDQGYAIEDRSGVVRWFVNQNDQLHWFEKKEEAEAQFPKIPPKSFTFISSNIHDNEILMNADPAYMANLEALSAVDRERLLNGNWNIRDGAGDYFKESWFEIVDSVPEFVMEARTWDFAATAVSEANPDPDWTVGLKGGIDADGTIYLTDMQRERINPTKVKQLLVNTTMIDGNQVRVRLPQDPGSAGKIVAHDYIRALKGYPVKALPVTGTKETRALPASAQAGIGNIKILRAHWNKDFLTEVSGFPLAAHDDTVDTLSDLVEELSNIGKRVYDDFQDCQSEVKDYESIMIGSIFVPEHVCLVVIVKRGKELHIVHEEVFLHDTREALSVIKEKFDTNPLEFYPSVTGRTRNSTNNTEIDIKLIKNAGHRVKSNEFEVPSKEIITACNEAFTAGTVRVNKYACPTLTLALEMQQYNLKNGLPDNEEGKFSVCEAMSYPIYKILQIRRSGGASREQVAPTRVDGY